MNTVQIAIILHVFHKETLNSVNEDSESTFWRKMANLFNK